MNLIQIFNEEFGYICYKYFCQTKVEPNYNYKNIILYINDLPYDRYKFTNGMEVLIPSYDNVLDGDFENIYIIHAVEPVSFSFRVINRKDGIVRTKDYNYHHDRGRTSTSFTYNEIDDFNNDFKKIFEETGLPIEKFVYQNYFENIEDSNVIICSSIKTNHDLKYYITSFTDSYTCLDEIDGAIQENKYQQIENNHLMLEMSEQLTMDKLKKIVKK